MRKILNLVILSILIIISAVVVLTYRNKSNYIVKQRNYAQAFYDKKLYKDAIKEFGKLNKEDLLKEDVLMIAESYLALEEFNTAINMSIEDFDLYKIPREKKHKIQENILKILDNKEMYKEYNKFFLKLDEELKSKYMDKYLSDYVVYGESFDQIRYTLNDCKEYIGKKDDFWYLITNKGKIKHSSKNEDILGWNSPYLTVINQGNTLVIDEKNDIRAHFDGVEYFSFQHPYIVKKTASGQIYIDRSSINKSKAYKKASNFIENKAVVVDNGVKLIDTNFSSINSIEGQGIKVDDRNNAIYDNKVIVKSNKYKIYDITKEKYSEEYDDIDFSYGQYIAVKNKNKWTYIDQDYKSVGDKGFSQAYSFSNDIGVIKENGGYKIINKNLKVIKEVEGEIYPFNEEGISFIKKEDKYYMIRLKRFINE
ncbi:hypothetical protein [uncultured Helcococcus sp.]|uniref:hypothetical protein n=1 Tax=uncultured Helcococcus sp. TaxID=1072508 RepID=UPI00288B4845|nr:hypothetical protein [uncultured Helcococcus sp.]